MATPTSLPATFVAGNVLTAAQMNDLRGAFRILQVVQTVKSDTFSTTSSTFTDITGFTVSITPSATSNKILIIADIKIGALGGSGGGAYVKLVRNSTDIYIGNAASSRTRVTYGFNNENTSADVGRLLFASTNVFLDSPNTTSATTYKMQGTRINGGTLTINSPGSDLNAAWWPRAASSITAMEISA